MPTHIQFAADDTIREAYHRAPTSTTDDNGHPVGLPTDAARAAHRIYPCQPYDHAAYILDPDADQQWRPDHAAHSAVPVTIPRPEPAPNPHAAEIAGLQTDITDALTAMGATPAAMGDMTQLIDAQRAVVQGIRTAAIDAKGKPDLRDAIVALTDAFITQLDLVTNVLILNTAADRLRARGVDPETITVTI